MDVNSIIELSPLHLSLPTFFLSLNLITSNYVFNWLIILILVSIYSISLSFLYSTTNSSMYMRLRWGTSIMLLVYANQLLQNINVVNLILINLVINNYNIYNEKSEKEFKFSLNWFEQYQSGIIWLIYVVYDYAMSQNLQHLIGYVLLLLPLQFFLYDSSKSFTDKMNSKLNVMESTLILLVSSSLLYFLNNDTVITNFNMLIISIGSMMILVISQFNKYQKYTSFFNKYLFIQNYKTNIIIINIIFTIVDYISNHQFNYYDIVFNLIMIFIMKPNYNDCFNFEQVQQTSVKEQNLVVELFTSQKTKSISRFLLLNTSFMFVQLLYSFRSKSLSLLSDSLHMLLDCTSLFLGLMANLISSKESDKFPFGLHKIENLAGFTNGCLLISIVASIFVEGFTRIFKPINIEKTTELLIVSFLGLVVNLVGIFAFNHGHEHGHSHTHEHKHEHKHEHGHSHLHSHLHSEPDDSDDSTTKDTKLDDNMHGIFLHILADTLGSVGVIISTIFIKFFNVQILDPLTSLFIGSLILLSSIPLIKSSVKNLLLSLTPEKTLFLKNQFFQDLLQLQGLKTYSTPRFWPTKDGKLTGYLHIIFFKSCTNTTLLREKVNDLLSQYEEQFDKVYIQYENEIDDCWCRS